MQETCRRKTAVYQLQKGTRALLPSPAVPIGSSRFFLTPARQQTTIHYSGRVVSSERTSDETNVLRPESGRRSGAEQPELFWRRARLFRAATHHADRRD